MIRKPTFAAMVASALMLAATGTAVLGSDEAAAAQGHGTHQMQHGGQMPGAEMDHSTHQMQDGSQMPGAEMDHSTHQMQDGSQMPGAEMEHGTHQDATGVADRPEALVLGGFALANLIVLAAAAVVRRRDGRRPGRGPATAGSGR